MKVCENGIVRDMTPEEIEELQSMQTEHPAAEPTAEERIAALEEQLRAIVETMAVSNFIKHDNEG